MKKKSCICTTKESEDDSSSKIREVGFWCSLFGGFSDFVHYFKKECYICYEISFEIVRHLLNLYKVSVPRCFEIFEKNKNAKIEIFAQSLQIE